MPQTPYSPPNVNLGNLVTLTAAATGKTSAVQVNSFYKGVQIGIDVTAMTGTSPTLTVTLEGVDPVNGTVFTVLASAALTATGYTTLTVFPGIAVTANVSANTVLPFKWQVATAVGGTTPAVTATITAAALV